MRLLEISSPEPLTGRLWHINGETYALRVTGSNTLQKLPASRILWVDVSEGRSRIRWGMLGAGIGLLWGGLLGALTIGQDPQADIGALGGFLIGGIPAAGAGAVVGVVSAPEQWRRIRAAR